MRVITGTARGTSLKTLEGLDVRPTSDMVKGVIFNSIQFNIEGRRVLDLFAGSGQLGIEALSRGAREATFVDARKESVEIIKTNLLSAKLKEKATVIHADYSDFLSHTKTVFDIAFLDPPYKKGLIEKALPKLAEIMSDYALIVCENDMTEELPEKAGGFTIKKQYKHSKTKVTVYKKGD